ncbi:MULTISPECIES: hypothetical protein [Rhodomicrobium]|uniref:hypothetical protein n=1 Tax=Rhodomicrobium TaxID=1068 RepID=UPI000B4C1A18|nr:MULTISPECIES: hypothetical protein [Rhodomicrobium]
MSRAAIEPRLLSQSQAAAYCGLCVSNFKKACPVRPVSLLARIPRYDRHALDRWIDSINNFRPIVEGDDLERMWHAGNRDARPGH